MTKRTTHFALTLPPREAGTPIGRWLYEAVRDGILAGRLRPGTRLPSTRDLARHYGISRGTVVQAFDELRWEGYLETRVGSGTTVSRTLPDDLLEVAGPKRTDEPPERRPPRRLSSYGRRVRRAGYLEDRPVRAFRTNQPALDLFPTALWAQIAGRRLRRSAGELLLVSEPAGYRPLREAVADYLATSRGVACEPARVAIVSGVQEGLDLAARLLLDPGDRVAIEDPGYDGARQVFEAVGAEVARVPVDAEGLALDAPGLKGARLVYVTPAHQFPLGVAMSLPRRLALLDWAAASGAVVFEDDYDSEFRYAGRPLPALQGLDRHGQVLFAGSFSKVLFPALRLGYLVVSEDLVERVAAALSITRRHAPLFEQAVLADFITEGHFGRHLRRMREVYAERLAVLMEEAEERLAGLVEISGIEAGLQTVGWLRSGLDGARAAEAAARRGVEVGSFVREGPGGEATHGLHLGFAAIAPPEIRRGARDLAAALEEELASVSP